MLTSLPLYAAIASQFAYTWGLYVAATQEPTYLAEIMGMKIESVRKLNTHQILIIYD